jgi:hypothetical protein
MEILIPVFIGGALGWLFAESLTKMGVPKGMRIFILLLVLGSSALVLSM